MSTLSSDLIGKSKLYIIEYAKKNNLIVDFSYTKGQKDFDILSEEYAVRTKYKNGELQVLLSYFKTEI